MIQNRWKNVIAQRGLTQAQVAKIAGISAPLFSSVVNGISILPMPDLESVCKALDIDPSKVYPTDVLKTIYGIESRKQAQRSVSIKLTGEQADFFVEAKKQSKFADGTNKEFVDYLVVEFLQNG